MYYVPIRLLYLTRFFFIIMYDVPKYECLNKYLIIISYPNEIFDNIDNNNIINLVPINIYKIVQFSDI